MADLNDHVHLTECAGLNLASSCDVKMLYQDNSVVTRSDCDSQLILITCFRTPVRLTALKLVGVAGEEPTILKLWCNKKEISFDDVDVEKPHFESAVTAEGAKGAPKGAKGAGGVEVKSIPVSGRDA